MSLETLERRNAGPRATLRSQKCREIAQSITQKEREEVRKKQTESYEKHESTAQSSQVLAVKRLVRQSPLDVSSDTDLKKLADENGNKKEAVTYWSHELIACDKHHFPVTPLKRGSPLFAKCTHFSNEIEDSRVRHNEADEWIS